MNDIVQMAGIEETNEGLVMAAPGAHLFTRLFLVVFCVFWDWACSAFIFRHVGLLRTSEISEPSLPVTLLFTAIGLAMSLYTIDQLLVRRQWIIIPGRILRRARMPFFGVVREQVYSGIQRVELRRGNWKSGSGHTDILRFSTYDRAQPIELSGLPISFSIMSAIRQSIAADKDHQPFKQPGAEMDSALSERIESIGVLVAKWVGVPLTHVEETIPDPKSD